MHLVLHKQACPQFTRVMNSRRGGCSDSQRMFRLECVHDGKVGISAQFGIPQIGLPSV